MTRARRPAPFVVRNRIGSMVVRVVAVGAVGVGTGGGGAVGVGAAVVFAASAAGAFWSGAGSAGWNDAPTEPAARWFDATLDGSAVTPDLLAPPALLTGTRAEAHLGIPGQAWSARIESVAAFAREGVLREVPGGVRIDALAALGDAFAIVGGARAQAAFGASTPERVGEAEVRPLVGARAEIASGRESGFRLDLDATPFDRGIGARAIYRTALDRAWQLELGVGVTHGLDAPWSVADDPGTGMRGAAWIGLRASF